MPSTFLGLEIGRRALSTSQLALDVIGQNTSNVSTPGYSRQVVDVQATDPYTPPDFEHSQPGELGTGVTVAGINRVRNTFLDTQIYTANSDQGAVDNLKTALGQVESAYGEPSDTGIGGLMTKFFNSFSDLASNPESTAQRSTVLNQAQTLTAQFHSVSATLSQISPQLTHNIQSDLKDANTIATQIADLNKQIRLSVATGDHPNDLLDKRGTLLNSLSSLVNVQTVNTTNPQSGKATGEVQVYVGGFALVQGDTSYSLPTTVTETNGAPSLVTKSGDTIALQGGAVAGLIKASTLLTGYQSDLNTLASSLITNFNAQHAAGYGLDGSTGKSFFTGTDAASISLDSSVAANPAAIAAATAPAAGSTFASGNGDNARALAAFTSSPLLNGGSLNDFYNSSVAQVGADSKAAQTQSDNQAKIVSLLNNQQSSFSGVSIDEELTNMLQYQRSYQAAARIINVMDDALNRIINGLGSGATG